MSAPEAGNTSPPHPSVPEATDTFLFDTSGPEVLNTSPPHTPIPEAGNTSQPRTPVPASANRSARRRDIAEVDPDRTCSNLENGYARPHMDVRGFVLITGAASGIGRACVQSFLLEGAIGVAMLDINNDALQQTKAEIEAHLDGFGSCKVITQTCDVSNELSIEAAITEAVTNFGRLDYVVHAAGVALKHPGGAACVNTEEWQHVINVNLTGSMFVLRGAARLMLEQPIVCSALDGRPLQRGSIVLVSSIQGVAGIAWSTAYAASKHAVLGLVRSASEDYASQGLRINAICPGYTETPLTTANPLILSAMQEKVRNDVPMQRMARPEEIADGILYLAGGRSSFVTGTALLVDGGYMQR